MPAVKNKRVKKIIEMYDKEEIEAASRFTMGNKKFGSVSFNLLIVKKDGCKESDPVEDRYVAFATSLPCRTKEELVKTIPETYKKRWIEGTGLGWSRASWAGRAAMRPTCDHYYSILHCCCIFCGNAQNTRNMQRGFIAGGRDFTMMDLESVQHHAKSLLRWELYHDDSFPSGKI